MKYTDRYVALLRGINVGGKNVLSMKSLIRIFAESGCSEIKSYIQSGNIVFTCKTAPPKDIDIKIENEFGFKPGLFFLSKDDFRAAVHACPFKSDDGKTIHFFICAENPDVDIDRLEKLRSDSETFKVIGKVLYLYAPDGIGRSKIAANAERCLGVPATARNWNTLNKLLLMLE